LTEGLGINVLLCRWYADNTPDGNLWDIRSARGHIIVCTVGRLTSLYRQDVGSSLTGPQVRVSLRQGNLATRNAVLRTSVFSTVQALIIDEATFIFAPKDGGFEEVFASLPTLFLGLHFLKFIAVREVVKLEPELLKTFTKVAQPETRQWLKVAKWIRMRIDSAGVAARSSFTPLTLTVDK
jgi:hypothetical protein